MTDTHRLLQALHRVLQVATEELGAVLEEEEEARAACRPDGEAYGPPALAPRVDPLLTAKEAAARLGISAWSVATFCKRGLIVARGGQVPGPFIRAAKMGRSWRIPASEIEAFVERQRS